MQAGGDGSAFVGGHCLVLESEVAQPLRELSPQGGSLARRLHAFEASRRLGVASARLVDPPCGKVSTCEHRHRGSAFQSLTVAEALQSGLGPSDRPVPISG